MLIKTQREYMKLIFKQYRYNDAYKYCHLEVQSFWTNHFTFRNISY